MAGPVAASATSFLAVCFLLLVAPGWWILGFMPLVASLAWVVSLLPAYRCFELVLEPERIVVKNGFGEAMLPLELSGVRGLSIRQSEPGKVLGYGDVHLRHVYGYWVFRTVRDPGVFKKRLKDGMVAARSATDVDLETSRIVS